MMLELAGLIAAVVVVDTAVVHLITTTSSMLLRIATPPVKRECLTMVLRRLLALRND
jgi:hypothetical protein